MLTGEKTVDATFKPLRVLHADYRNVERVCERVANGKPNTQTRKTAGASKTYNTTQVMDGFALLAQHVSYLLQQRYRELPMGIPHFVAQFSLAIEQADLCLWFVGTDR